MRLLKRLGSMLFYIFLVICFLISMEIVRGKVSGTQPEILGYKFFIVLTGSMEPELMVGDIVIVKSVNPKEIETKDIITFQSKESNNIITHRVKEIKSNEENQFITKGDANNVEDPNPVDSDKVIGKVVGHAPKIGLLIQILQNNVIKIVGSILLVSIIAAFIIGIRKGKNSKELKHNN